MEWTESPWPSEEIIQMLTTSEDWCKCWPHLRTDTNADHIRGLMQMLTDCFISVTLTKTKQTLGDALSLLLTWRLMSIRANNGSNGKVIWMMTPCYCLWRRQHTVLLKTCFPLTWGQSLPVTSRWMSTSGTAHTYCSQWNAWSYTTPPNLPLSELILPCALTYPSCIMYTPDHIPPPPFWTHSALCPDLPLLYYVHSWSHTPPPPPSELILPCALTYPSCIMYTPDHIPPPYPLLNSFCPVPWLTPPILCTLLITYPPPHPLLNSFCPVPWPTPPVLCTLLITYPPPTPFWTHSALCPDLPLLYYVHSWSHTPPPHPLLNSFCPVPWPTPPVLCTLLITYPPPYPLLNSFCPVPWPTPPVLCTLLITYPPPYPLLNSFCPVPWPTPPVLCTLLITYPPPLPPSELILPCALTPTPPVLCTLLITYPPPTPFWTHSALCPDLPLLYYVHSWSHTPPPTPFWTHSALCPDLPLLYYVHSWAAHPLGKFGNSS